MGLKIVKDGKVVTRPEIGVIVAKPGESGLLEGISEERVIRLAELIADGATDAEIRDELRMSEYVLRRAKRTKVIQEAIKREATARAIASYPELVSKQVDDAKSDENPKVRSEAFKNVKSVIEGAVAPVVNQVNNISEWDPSRDEALYERAKTMFQDTSKRVIADIIDSVQDSEDD